MQLAAAAIHARLQSLGNETIAAHSLRFFKTGPGEYGAGDQFLGIRMPTLRKLASEFRGVSLSETLRTLQSSYHEERMLALLLLVTLFQKGGPEQKQAVYEAYLANTRLINNWDLVDGSARFIVGPYLEDKDRSQLYTLAASPDLWERRIAVLATYHYITRHDFTDILQLAEILLQDSEDLIQKAVGWMLREVGNRDKTLEETFLLKHYRNMPRTMLRYAIEKFPTEERKQYLQGLR
ncbi:DNA alkylation repair protein [Hahella sp. KA22]|uniref:DNA alkylation repair protein n=1 Tax=Hahella sp. KA22 TaxID=1628392 RepID=UPI000FDD7030|nr:DNA alkylation repair protein [Hahella sp. KA22]AZZ90754.1 DNA alkylation repair protein [Hahella sp. KA22]QAY54125.1 DNA alkylation repair protein [Hahella sp. KA22]